MYQSETDKNTPESSPILPTSGKNTAKTTKRSGSERIENRIQQKQVDFVGNTPRIQQFVSFQRMVDASPKVQRTAQLMAFQDNSNSAAVIQRVINVAYQDHTEDDDRAGSTEATVSGDTLPLGSNAPSVYPTGWDEIAEKYEMDDVVRMHLWNGRLGGPGNQTWNLTPGLNDVNTDMALEEVKAQAEVNGGNVVTMDTTATYGHSIDENDPEYYYPSHITFNWLSQDDEGDTVDEGTWDEDIPLPTVKDEDYDPNNPDDLGLEDDDVE